MLSHHVFNEHADKQKQKATGNLLVAFCIVKQAHITWNPSSLAPDWMAFYPFMTHLLTVSTQPI